MGKPNPTKRLPTTWLDQLVMVRDDSDELELLAFENESAAALFEGCLGAGAVGNKHWMFMLEGCVNPEPVRGIYNEFLRGDLEPHRKVFEVLGSKTKCEPTPNQLSGLGFTAARNDEVTVRVTTDSNTRAYSIVF